MIDAPVSFQGHHRFKDQVLLNYRINVWLLNVAYRLGHLTHSVRVWFVR